MTEETKKEINVVVRVIAAIIGIFLLLNGLSYFIEPKIVIAPLNSEGNIVVQQGASKEIIPPKSGAAHKEIESTTKSTIQQNGKTYVNTQNGVTLTVVGYSFEKKSETYGKLLTVDLIIENKGSKTITPDLLVYVEDKKETAFSIQKEVGISSWLSEGDSIQKSVVVDLGVAGANDPKEMRIYVKDSWGDIITTVRFNTNLLEGFK